MIKPKIFSTPIDISNHWNIDDNPNYARQAIGWTTYDSEDRILLLYVITKDSVGNFRKELTELYRIKALGDKSINSSFEGPKRNALGERIYKYEFQSGTEVKLIGREGFSFISGGYLLDDNGNKIPNPDWETAISEADFLYNFTIGLKKSVYSLTDSSTDKQEKESYLTTLIQDLDVNGHRFDIQGEKVDFDRLGLTDSEKSSLGL